MNVMQVNALATMLKITAARIEYETALGTISERRQEIVDDLIQDVTELQNRLEKERTKA